MKPVQFAVCALLLYAFQNVFLEVKLAKYNQMAILLYSYAAMLPLALAGWWQLRATQQSVAAPEGFLRVLVVLSGIMYFAADYCFVSAYTSGGDLLSVTTIVVLFPVFSTAIKYFWVGGLPNRYQIGGYALAAAAVVLLSKGEAG